MANEIVLHYLGIICEGGNKAKDDKFARYRTRFGELRKIKQICSHLCCKPEERDDKAVPPKRHNYKAIPSRHYFDVLHGPELEIHKDKEEKCATEEHWPFLLRFPITCFGICLGVCSQAILWKALASTPSMEFLHVPQIINLVLWSLGLVALTIVFVVYTLKCIFYFEAVRIEYYHPVRGNYIFAPWIACMFLALGVPPLIAKSVNPALWCAFMFPVLCLELKIYGQWMLGGSRRLSEVAHPSNYLTSVGNFVGALLGAETGWKEGAMFFFAVGLAHYMVLFVTLYQRLHTAKAVGCST